MSGSIDMFPDAAVDYIRVRRDLIPVINRVAANLWLDPGYQVDSMEMIISNSPASKTFVTLRLVPGQAGLQVTWADSGETEVWPRLPHS